MSALAPVRIPFHKPSLSGRESIHIAESLRLGKLCGGGPFTQRCEEFFLQRYGFHRSLFTTSGTDALEMCGLLLNLQPGDEVILPSFTFVSVATAFRLRGAKLVFADSMPNHPNIDCSLLESLITPRTKAIVAVHYAGAACDLDFLRALVDRHGIALIEDAAHSIDATYRGLALGSIGSLATFSFHETKNITSGGEGGLLVVNDPRFVERAEILRDKGTNRARFLRGSVEKYQWIDLGSSFIGSDLLAAFLLGQLESIDQLQSVRVARWHRYAAGLRSLADSGAISLPPDLPHAVHNAHLFYLTCRSIGERAELLQSLRERGIQATFHYQSLHNSPYYASYHDGRELPHSDAFTGRLLRLPLHSGMTEGEVDEVIEAVEAFYQAAAVS